MGVKSPFVLCFQELEYEWEPVDVVLRQNGPTIRHPSAVHKAFMLDGFWIKYILSRTGRIEGRTATWKVS